MTVDSVDCSCCGIIYCCEAGKNVTVCHKCQFNSRCDLRKEAKADKTKGLCPNCEFRRKTYSRW